MKKVFDCAVIGGGVVGCSVLRALRAYEIDAVLLEAGSDVAGGASRANSGIVHAGYDCTPGTNKARLNALGNRLYPTLCKQLKVNFGACGSLVVAGADELDKLHALKARGDQNGIRTEIIGRARILELEPNVADRIEYALWAPDAGIVSPYKFTIAMADNAIINGAEIKTEFKAVSIKKKDGAFAISDGQQTVYAKMVVNSAGANAPGISRIAGAEVPEQVLRRGEYLLLDNSEIKNIRRVIFPLPSEKGKGILVAPTVDGNVIYGPTSEVIPEYTTATSAEGMNLIKTSVAQSYKAMNFRKVIKVYAGVRAICGDDFIVRFSERVKGFYMIAGICSPGLTAAPAIAQQVAAEAADFLQAKERDGMILENPGKPRLTTMSDATLAEYIQKDPAWGNVICRCENVSEAEIVAAIHSPLKATSTDAVKRRVRAGMGRCSGGFCLTEVMEIIARECGIPIEQVKKDNVGSEIVVSEIKEGGYEL